MLGHSFNNSIQFNYSMWRDIDDLSVVLGTNNLSDKAAKVCKIARVVVNKDFKNWGGNNLCETAIAQVVCESPITESESIKPAIVSFVPASDIDVITTGRICLPF